MSRTLLGGVLVLIAGLGFLAYTGLFQVHQTQNALVLRFGEVRHVITEPGLHWKVPVADNVVRIDRRILDLDSPVQEVIASDQRRLVVDAFARYRIADPLRFYQAVGSINAANSRMATVLNASLRRVLGEQSFFAVVRDRRDELMREITRQVNAEAEGFGIDVVDVRIRRADLPQANAEAIFARMQTERQQEAAQIRAEGEEEARRIRSRADRDSTVIVAQANRDSERLRGEGDGRRSSIYAEAFGQDEDFYAFYRSMQAYEIGLAADHTQLVLSPESEFFRYFGDQRGNRTLPVMTEERLDEGVAELLNDASEELDAEAEAGAGADAETAGTAAASPVQ